MGVFALIIFANLHILSHSISLEPPYNKLNIHCNSSYPCNNITFHIKPFHDINIICNQINSCNNLSIVSLSPHRPKKKCNIHCQTSHSCNDIHQLKSHCSCYGHCMDNISNRRSLIGSDNILSDLPDYVYLIIIFILVLICGVCLCVLCWKWRHERRINRDMSEREQRRQFNEEQRSLSGKHDPQLITENSNTHTLQNNSINFNQNFAPNKQNNNMINMIQHKNNNNVIMLSPESIPLSDPNRATSPFTLNTATFTHTPSPEPYNPGSPYHNNSIRTANIGNHISETHQSTNSNSNVISNDYSQFSSQQSSQPHPAMTIIMQPVPSPNTTPQSNTKEISAGHNAIITHKKSKGYNQNSLSMSSVSIPYNHRKESITTTYSNKQNTNAIKEENEMEIQTQIEITTIHVIDKEREIEEIVNRRNKKDHFVLNLPLHVEHEKSNSNISLSSIPLDKISIMAPQESHPSDDAETDHEVDHEVGIKEDHEEVSKEEDKPLSPQNNQNINNQNNNQSHNMIEYQSEINNVSINNQTSSDSESDHINMNMIKHKSKPPKKSKIPSNEMIDKHELANVFKSDDDTTEDNNEIISDHEYEFAQQQIDMDEKKRKKKKKKKDKKHKKKKKKKKKKKSRNAAKPEEVEYEPDFFPDMEGTAANHNPPSHVMGVLPQQLAKQIEMDKYDDKHKSQDVQSTVSSHPAFDMKNLKHYITNDGTLTGNEYKEDDEEESMSSNTSNSDDEYSYSTSNAEEYVPNDAMSLASEDPFPLHYVNIAHNVGFMDSIKEDKILVTPSDNDITPNGDEYITPHENGNNNQEYKPNETKNIFEDAVLNQEEFFKCLYNEINVNKNNNFHASEIYGLIISFMGRHDRWLHCRLVCKIWNQLVYNTYWIYTEHITINEANRLRPGDKVDHRDDAGRWIKSTILGVKGTLFNVHYDGWSSKWDSWCDYSTNLHKFASARSISRCPRVRGKQVEEKMFVDIKPSYRHGRNCNWRKGKVRRFDKSSGQIEVIYKYKQKKYLLWVHLDNKNEVDRLGKHTHEQRQQYSNPNLLNHSSSNRYSNYSLATTIHE